MAIENLLLAYGNVVHGICNAKRRRRVFISACKVPTTPYVFLYPHFLILSVLILCWICETFQRKPHPKCRGWVPNSMSLHTSNKSLPPPPHLFLTGRLPLCIYLISFKCKVAVPSKCPGVVFATLPLTRCMTVYRDSLRVSMSRKAWQIPL